ncbi:MAG: imidazole glycerol phosphate synthase subunit HisH [Candidatus Coproplasma sp.]
MIAIIDYGVGNLFSLCCSLKKIGVDSVVTGDKTIIERANALILPGVGAFGDAAKKLEDSGLSQSVLSAVDRGKPLLGICLGMQLLFDKSFEYGEHRGLGLIGGEVKPLADQVDNLKIPHMGWNSLKFKNGKSPLFKYIDEDDYVYFVHSYYADCDKESLIATCEYGIEVTAAVAKDNVYGTQFHPEKSGNTGLKILRAFAEIGGEEC